MGDSKGEKENILSILAKRPIVGDGSYVFTLEKRGYVKGGSWTPEAVVEYPDGVRQLHREYLRCGSDVLQAFTFYAASGKLKTVNSTKEYTSDDLNEAGCQIVKEVADTRPGTLICGGLSPTPTYMAGGGEEAVKKEFRAQIEIFTKHQTDFLLAEFLGHVEEAEWAIQAMKETKLPVACTMRMGPTGDLNDVPVGECAVRMAKAGADILGLNCQYDYRTCIETIKTMKAALDAEGLKPFLMVQPVGFHVPEVACVKFGYHDLPEFPFALESRLLTRWDCREFAREAYKAGVRYFGGCCGFEPYHIREMAAELAKERGFMMPGEDKFSDWGANLVTKFRETISQRSTREYWENLKPASGRPDCACISKPQTVAGDKKK